MKIIDGYAIEVSSELVPQYSISPFNVNFVRFNKHLSQKGIRLDIDELLNDFFGNHIITTGGRSAIFIALSHYSLAPDDVVSIITTSDNFYISSCVTKEIERFCKWSRKIESNTKLIFVNHEFGYPYGNLLRLREYGIPIIEDRAHSFFSVDKNALIGTVGDFVIYSLPKAFPIPLGGILVNNTGLCLKKVLDESIEQYIKVVLAYWLPQVECIKEKRLSNYKYLEKQFDELGLSPFFPMEDGIVPGVFMFGINRNIDLPNMKIYMQSNGIESSVFYGKSAYFIPAHQNLDMEDMDYFVEVVRSYIS